MKSKKKYNSRTALRLTHKQREEIDLLVLERKFDSLSHVVRAALTEFLEKQGVENCESCKCVY